MTKQNNRKGTFPSTPFQLIPVDTSAAWDNGGGGTPSYLIGSPPRQHLIDFLVWQHSWYFTTDSGLLGLIKRSSHYLDVSGYTCTPVDYNSASWPELNDRPTWKTNRFAQLQVIKTLHLEATSSPVGFGPSRSHPVRAVFFFLYKGVFRSREIVQFGCWSRRWQFEYSRKKNDISPHFWPIPIIRPHLIKYITSEIRNHTFLIV